VNKDGRWKERESKREKERKRNELLIPCRECMKIKINALSNSNLKLIVWKDLFNWKK
jgi:hypothetical protein